MPKKEMKSARDFVPAHGDLDDLMMASQKCRGCDLYKHATQAVFGEGRSNARIVFVGEQPGDIEDKNGHPFIGPAGRLLDNALAAAGFDREDGYFTNAVKHFSFTQRGKRRLHKKPRVIEIRACFPWLEAELEKLKPEMIVCLGASATRAVLGANVKVMENRGQFVQSDWAPYVMVTVHPSSILRAPDHAAREAQMEDFIADLKRAVGKTT